LRTPSSTSYLAIRRFDDLRAFSFANADDSRRHQQKKTWQKKGFLANNTPLIGLFSMAVVKYADMVPD